MTEESKALTVIVVCMVLFAAICGAAMYTVMTAWR